MRLTSFGQCPTNGNSDVPISLILDEAVTNSLEHTLPAQVSCCRCDLSPGAHSSPGWVSSDAVQETVRSDTPHSRAWVLAHRSRQRRQILDL